MSQLEKLLESFFAENSFEKYSTRVPSPVLMQKLDEDLGRGSTCYPIIHVAGTNGKGSVVGKIAAACEAAGYKVGVYTSPHLYTPHERIRINQEMISSKDLTHYVELVVEKAKAHDAALHFFEIMTAVAFRYFADKKVDVAIVEVGIGGLEDATNFITPILSIITSISLDHTKVLGKTLEEIAIQKAGIIKQDIPVVLGPSAYRESILQVAKLRYAYVIASTESGFSFDEENSAIAKHSLNYLKGFFRLQEKDILAGLKVMPPCRLEIWSTKISQVVIFDVAHNPGGFTKLFSTIQTTFGKRDIHLVLGLGKNKELLECLQVITKQVKTIHLVPAVHDKLVDPKTLAAFLESMGYFDYFMHREVDDVAREVFQLPCEDIVVVAGSFYIMAEMKEAASTYLAAKQLCPRAQLLV